jgi:hypothetical protein
MAPELDLRQFRRQSPRTSGCNLSRNRVPLPQTFGLSSTTSKDMQVRLEPPRIAVLSTHHYVNHGGSEMVLYKVTPSDVQFRVRVGDVEYRGRRRP